MYASIGKSGAGKTVLNSFLMGCPAFRLKRCSAVGQFFSLQLKGRVFANRFRLMRRWRDVRRNGVLLYLPQHLPDGRGFDMRVKEYYSEIVKALLRECDVVRSTKEVLSVFDGGADEIDKLARTLKDKLARPLNRLSGGERRRVELIARMYALRELPADKKCLLVLDEPTTGLDVPGVKEYLAALRKCFDECNHKNVSILVTTHALHLLRNGDVFDDVIIVRRIDDSFDGKDTLCWVSRPLATKKMAEAWVKPKYGEGEEGWSQFLEAQARMTKEEYVAERRNFFEEGVGNVNP